MFEPNQLTKSNIEQNIINTLLRLKGDGNTKEQTIKRIGATLTKLSRLGSLDNPEQVRLAIADLKNQDGKQADNQTKNKYATAYNHYCITANITWKKPFYKVVEKTPLIPTRQNVQAIIDNSSEAYVCVFTLEAEIGCSPEELYLVTRKDIDTEKGEISITGVKKHASKNYKLKPQTKELLTRYLAQHQQEHPFPKAHAQSQAWQKFKKRASYKLHRPELLKIQLRNLRNFSGEQFYKSLPIRDPILLMQHFRHKKLERTMHCIRAIALDFEEDDNWICRLSTTIQDDQKLIEAGFQYMTERNGTKLYRKRK